VRRKKGREGDKEKGRITIKVFKILMFIQQEK